MSRPPFQLNFSIRRTLAAKFAELSCEASSFTGLQATAGARWLRPSVVVSVDYRDFNGRLRHPSLKGLLDVQPWSVALPRAAGP
jgi:bifunctional non-homologous end joining protein LigD